MNVACEHCGAEYSLDEESVSPRGVRITCPSCSHVFTVYPEVSEEEIELEIEFEVESIEEIVEPEDEIDDEVDLEISIDIDGALEDVLAQVEIEKPQKKIPEEAPKKSKKQALEDSLKKLDGESKGEDGESLLEELSDLPSETEEAVKALNPEDLDFAKVGLRNWKVKTGFGLVYDFSDYKTLNKYLRDGKVKETDLLSYDGKHWVPMKEIEDLGEYFSSVYLKFLKHQAGEVVETEKTKKKGIRRSAIISTMGGMSDLAAAIAEAQAEVDGATSPQPKRKASRTPVGSATSPRLKQPSASRSSSRTPSRSPSRNSSRSSAPPQQEKRPSIVGFVIGIILIGGAVWFFSNNSSKVESENNNTANTKQLTNSQKEDGSKADSLRSEIQEKIKQSAKKAKEETETDLPEPSNEEPQLMVKVPEEILAKMRAEQAAKKGQATTVKPTNNVDFAEQGRQALAAKDWNKAVSSYQKAYQQSPRPAYKEMWGYALFQSGNSAMAKPILQQAVKEGAIGANKWLGYLYRKDGDIAGSNKYFTAYLASNPVDAQQIQQEMRK